MLVFEERGKQEYPEKNLSEKGENQQQSQPAYDARSLDGGQTREICEKREKYSKGKVVTLTLQSLVLYQYPVDLLTCFDLYYKSSK